MLRQIEIEANGKSVSADVYITNANGPAIVGRTWLKAFNLWPLFLDLKYQTIKPKVVVNEKLKSIIKKHEAVFTGRGKFTKGEVKLELKEEAKPKYLLARSVPFALKERIENELKRLESQGTIEAIEHSEWATPIVPVLKPDNSIRMCADFKVTLNPQLITVRHPAPNFVHAVAQLQAGVKYSKLDLKEAYLQMPVEEKSQMLLTINTHMGLFKYKYMSFGISSAPGIFQLRMEEILKGIPGVAIVVDDVVVTGKTTDEHLTNLDRVLGKLNECGLKVRVEKFKFFEDKITYLGFEISGNEIKVDSHKYQAIDEMSRPKDHKDLQLFLGKINYYGRLINKRAEKLAALYECQGKEEFVWNEACEKAFVSAKESLKQAVVNYDPKLHLILTCDTSPLVLAAYLSQPYPNGDKPVAFASKRLSEAQKGTDNRLIYRIFGPEITYLHSVVQSEIARFDYKTVARETSNDKILSIVKRLVESGCKVNGWPDELKSYAQRKDELSVKRGCLMWGQRVIIPQKVRKRIVEQLHECHFGIVKMKSLARSVVWWPSIDNELENAAKYCQNCVQAFSKPFLRQITQQQMALQRILSKRLNVKTTKHSTTGETPAKLLFKRKLRTSLHLVQPDVKYYVTHDQKNQRITMNYQLYFCSRS
ncbi:uncharacterized protein K02A2.6-like [Copidosoma floridanum]|uniref:uncharacterized protein K02A2.6-like n=1 Tax=Copidosoma floridanum TaxID=29053 RepID=UPI0006C9A7D8|nr:uncharacterized protein K02A2.6-like [Copidosoma floridanum]